MINRYAQSLFHGTVEVFSAVVAWLHTASPMYTLLVMERVAVPTVAHVLPSAEDDAVIVVPERTSFSQRGAAPDPPATYAVDPPFDVRASSSKPLDGVTSRSTCGDPVVSDWRIITPAFATELVFCIEATRATICPSPASDW